MWHSDDGNCSNNRVKYIMNVICIAGASVDVIYNRASFRAPVFGNKIFAKFRCNSQLLLPLIYASVCAFPRQEVHMLVVINCPPKLKYAVVAWDKSF